MDQTVFKKIRCKEAKPLLLGQPREKIKADAIIESAYEKDGEDRLEKQVVLRDLFFINFIVLLYV